MIFTTNDLFRGRRYLRTPLPLDRRSKRFIQCWNRAFDEIHGNTHRTDFSIVIS